MRTNQLTDTRGKWSCYRFAVMQFYPTYEARMGNSILDHFLGVKRNLKVANERSSTKLYRNERTNERSMSQWSYKEKMSDWKGAEYPENIYNIHPLEMWRKPAYAQMSHTCWQCLVHCLLEMYMYSSLGTFLPLKVLVSTMT